MNMKSPVGQAPTPARRSKSVKSVSSVDFFFFLGCRFQCLPPNLPSPSASSPALPPASPSTSPPSMPPTNNSSTWSWNINDAPSVEPVSMRAIPGEVSPYRWSEARPRKDCNLTSAKVLASRAAMRYKRPLDIQGIVSDCEGSHGHG